MPCAQSTSVHCPPPKAPLCLCCDASAAVNGLGLVGLPGNGGSLDMEFIDPDTDSWEACMADVPDACHGLELEPIATASCGELGASISAAAIAVQTAEGEAERVCVLSDKLVYILSSTIDEGMSAQSLRSVQQGTCIDRCRCAEDAVTATSLAVDLGGVPSAAAWSQDGSVLAVGDEEGKVHFLSAEGALLFSQVVFKADGLGGGFATLGFLTPPSILQAQPELVLLSKAGSLLRLGNLPLASLSAAAAAGDAALLRTHRRSITQARGQVGQQPGVARAALIWAPACTAVVLPGEGALLDIWGVRDGADSADLLCSAGGPAGAGSLGGLAVDGGGRFLFAGLQCGDILLLDMGDFVRSSAVDRQPPSQTLSAPALPGATDAPYKLAALAALPRGGSEDEEGSDAAALALGAPGGPPSHLVVLVALLSQHGDQPDTLASLRVLLEAGEDGTITASLTLDAFCRLPPSSTAQPALLAPPTALARYLLVLQSKATLQLWGAVEESPHAALQRLLAEGDTEAAQAWAQQHRLEPGEFAAVEAQVVADALSSACHGGAVDPEDEAEQVRRLAQHLDAVETDLALVVQLCTTVCVTQQVHTEKLLQYAAARCKLARDASATGAGSEQGDSAQDLLQAVQEQQYLLETYKRMVSSDAAAACFAQRQGTAAPPSDEEGDGEGALWQADAWHAFRDTPLVDTVARLLAVGAIPALQLLCVRHGGAQVGKALASAASGLPHLTPPTAIVALLKTYAVPVADEAGAVALSRLAIARAVAWEAHTGDPQAALQWLAVGSGEGAVVGAHAPQQAILAACSRTQGWQAAGEAWKDLGLQEVLCQPPDSGLMCVQAPPGLPRLRALLQAQASLLSTFNLRVSLKELAQCTPGDVVVMLLDVEEDADSLPTHVSAVVASFTTQHGVDLAACLTNYILDLTGALQEVEDPGALEHRIVQCVRSIADPDARVDAALQYLKGLSPPFSHHADAVIRECIATPCAHDEAVTLQLRLMHLHSLFGRYPISRANLSSTMHARLVLGYVTSRTDKPGSVFDAMCLCAGYPTLSSQEATCGHILALAIAPPHEGEVAFLARQSLHDIVCSLPPQTMAAHLHDVISGAASTPEPGAPLLRRQLAARADRAVAALFAPLRAAAALHAWRHGRWEDHVASTPEEDHPAHLVPYHFAGAMRRAIEGHLAPPAPQGVWRVDVEALEAATPAARQEASLVCSAMFDTGLGSVLQAFSLQRVAHCAAVALQGLAAARTKHLAALQAALGLSSSVPPPPSAILALLSALEALMKASVAASSPPTMSLFNDAYLWQWDAVTGSDAWAAAQLDEQALTEQVTAAGGGEEVTLSAALHSLWSVLSCDTLLTALSAAMTLRGLLPHLDAAAWSVHGQEEEQKGHLLGVPVIPTSQICLTPPSLQLDCTVAVSTWAQQHRQAFRRLQLVLGVGLLGVPGSEASVLRRLARDVEAIGKELASPDAPLRLLSQAAEGLGHHPLLVQLQAADAALRSGDSKAAIWWLRHLPTATPRNALRAAALQVADQLAQSLATMMKGSEAAAKDLAEALNDVGDLQLRLAPWGSHDSSSAAQSACHLPGSVLSHTDQGEYASTHVAVAAPRRPLTLAADLFGGSASPAAGLPAASPPLSVPGSDEAAALASRAVLGAAWQASGSSVISTLPAVQAAGAASRALLAGTPSVPEVQALVALLHKNRCSTPELHVQAAGARVPPVREAMQRLLHHTLHSGHVDARLAILALFGGSAPLAIEELRSAATGRGGAFARLATLGCLGVDLAAALGDASLAEESRQLLTSAHWWQLFAGSGVQVHPDRMQVRVGSGDGDGYAASLLPVVLHLAKFEVEQVQGYCSAYGVPVSTAACIGVQMLLAHPPTLDACTTSASGEPPVIASWHHRVQKLANIAEASHLAEALQAIFPKINAVDYGRLQLALTLLCRADATNTEAASTLEVLSVISRYSAVALQPHPAVQAVHSSGAASGPFYGAEELSFAPPSATVSGRYKVWVQQNAPSRLPLHELLEEPWSVLMPQLTPARVSSLLSLALTLGLPGDELYLHLARRMTLTLVKQTTTRARRAQIHSAATLALSHVQHIATTLAARSGMDPCGPCSTAVIFHHVPAELLPAGAVSEPASAPSAPLGDWDSTGLPSTLTLPQLMQQVAAISNAEVALEVLEWALQQIPSDRVQLLSLHPELHEALWGDPTAPAADRQALTVRVAMPCSGEGGPLQVQLTLPLDAACAAEAEVAALFGHTATTLGVLHATPGTTLTTARMPAGAVPDAHAALDSATQRTLSLAPFLPHGCLAQNGAGTPIVGCCLPLQAPAMPAQYAVLGAGGQPVPGAPVVDSAFLDTAALPPPHALRQGHEVYLQCLLESPDVTEDGLEAVRAYNKLLGEGGNADSAKLPPPLRPFWNHASVVGAQGSTCSVLLDEESSRLGLLPLRLCTARAACGIAMRHKNDLVEIAGSEAALMADGGVIGDAYAALMESVGRILEEASMDASRMGLAALGPAAYAMFVPLLETPGDLVKGLLAALAAPAACVALRGGGLGNGVAAMPCPASAAAATAFHTPLGSGWELFEFLFCLASKYSDLGLYSAKGNLVQRWLLRPLQLAPLPPLPPALQSLEPSEVAEELNILRVLYVLDAPAHVPMLPSAGGKPDLLGDRKAGGTVLIKVAYMKDTSRVSLRARVRALSALLQLLPPLHINALYSKGLPALGQYWQECSKLAALRDAQVPVDLLTLQGSDPLPLVRGLWRDHGAMRAAPLALHKVLADILLDARVEDVALWHTLLSSMQRRGWHTPVRQLLLRLAESGMHRSLVGVDMQGVWDTAIAWPTTWLRSRHEEGPPVALPGGPAQTPSDLVHHAAAVHLTSSQVWEAEGLLEALRSTVHLLFVCPSPPADLSALVQEVASLGSVTASIALNMAMTPLSHSTKAGLLQDVVRVAGFLPALLAALGTGAGDDLPGAAASPLPALVRELSASKTLLKESLGSRQWLAIAAALAKFCDDPTQQSVVQVLLEYGAPAQAAAVVAAIYRQGLPGFLVSVTDAEVDVDEDEEELRGPLEAWGEHVRPVLEGHVEEAILALKRLQLYALHAPGVEETLVQRLFGHGSGGGPSSDMP